MKFSLAYANTFGGTGLLLGGSGTMVVNGDASGVLAPTTAVINTATLVVNSSWGAPILVDLDATLKGSGTISGLVEVYGTHAVGNSAGIQTVENGVSYLSGSTFEWELSANSQDTTGTNFDQLQVTGGDITIEGGSTIELVFNSAGSLTDWDDSFWDSNHTWTVIDMLGSGSLLGSMFSISSDYLDANGIALSSLRTNAEFSISGSGDDVVLTYISVPEPTSATLLGLSLMLIGWAARRKREVSRPTCGKFPSFQATPPQS